MNEPIGQYQISGELGRGGMGVVYRARDTRLDRDVAIKSLPTALAADPERLARSQREAKILASLNHPNIGGIYGLEETDTGRYLILEYVEGRTLSDRLSDGPIPVAEALAIAVQVADALAAAHEKGIIHRDLKPGNVMVTAGGRVKVLDFGLAHTAGDARSGDALASDPDTPTASIELASPATRIGAVMGTPGYMSPEQARGEPVDTSSDVFSFGCLLYEMLTGGQPFTGETVAEAIGATIHTAPALDAIPDAAPAAVRELLERCLAKDRSQRYASGAELHAALQGLAQWAREEAIPTLAGLCEQIGGILEESRESWTAFELAREIDKCAPGDPIVESLRPAFSSPISIVSDPPGARVRAAFYDDPDNAGIDFGQTPMHEVRFPRGLSRLVLELPGYRPTRDLVWNLRETLTNAMDPATRTFRYTLRKPEELPEEMEEVPAGAFTVFMPGLDHMEPEPTAAFLIDRHPVTNREYKRFVDDGGYGRDDLWPGPFEAEDGEITREELMAHLVDQIGQPGPTGWVLGEYPAGEGNHPVTGVCWYEARAYAAWAGKSLPTLFHWSRVASTHASGQIAPAANFSGRGTVPVGTTQSLNRFGVHDLAGNVREWVVNPVSRPGKRFILGGGWNDPSYAFIDAYAQPALDRSLSNGFRCIRPLEPDPNADRLARMMDLPYRDFRAERPVPDEVFEFFRRQFHYDRAPLDAELLVDEPVAPARWQCLEIAAAYGGERMQAHLYLPTRGQPPYQTVVVYPGSNALHTRIYNHSEYHRLDFLTRSGRAVLVPVFKGTYEREAGIISDCPNDSARYKELVIMWAKDLARAVDLVESRDDLDSERIAYYGLSWGGAMGAIMPAVETRIKANILYVAGFSFQRCLPECDQLNYVTRVKQPTLMLNGELDFFFPAEDSQRPMFDLLGTPAEHKKRLTYPRGHTVPVTDLIRESLAWLDRYLGPVG